MHARPIVRFASGSIPASLIRRACHVVSILTRRTPLRFLLGDLVRLAVAVGTVAGFTAVSQSLQGQNACSTTPTGTQYSTTGTITTPNSFDLSPHDGSPYPSTITVPGTGVVTGIQIRLNGISAAGGGSNGNTALNGMEVLLVSPSGTEMEIMGGVGTNTVNVTGLTILIGDHISTANFPYMPNISQDPPASGTACWAPSDYTGAAGEFGSPVNVSAIQYPQTEGSTTLASVFDGQLAAGVWKLYVVDDFGNPESISGWDLFLTVSQISTPTTTSISSNRNPVFTTSPNNSVTFTATVSANGSPVSQGTVTFADGSTNLVCSGGNPVALNGAGQATCTATLSTQGLHTINATYSGNTSYQTSSGNLTELAEAHPTQTGNTWCNSGSITVPSAPSVSSVYPSVIPVSGYPSGTTVTNVTVQLKGTAFTPPSDQFLLVAPGGGMYNLDFLDYVFNGSAVSGVSFTVADAGTSPLDQAPTNGATWLPWDGNLNSPNDTWPSTTATTFDASIPQVPGTINRPQGLGSQTPNPLTLASAFTGAPANGDWALYVYGSSPITLSNGWCINVLSQPTMSVGSNHTGSFTQGDASDTYSITVTNNGPVSSSGTMSLTDTLPSSLSAVSFAETAHTGGGTGSDWSCTGTSCTRTTAMPSGEQDTLTLTVGVGYGTAFGSNAVTNSVNVSGGNASNSPTATDPTTVNPGPVQVTFNTSPAGLTYSINGTQFSSQQILTVTNGTAVVLATTSPQTLSGTQYNWSNWSDSGTLSHTATINSTSGIAQYTATFTPSSSACTNPNPNPNPNPAAFAVLSDFNGDCRSDILWRNSTSQQAYAWLMNGISISSQGGLDSPASQWIIQGVGDFNGDGKSDILWRNTSTGEVYLWFINGTTIAGRATLGSITSDWVIQGVGDFDGNGKSDILWRNSTTGQVYLWFMNGSTVTSQGGVIPVSSDWVIQDVGDFNGDGKADILWRNSNTGQVYLWLMNGTSIVGQGSPLTVSSDWVIQGVGDFDGDGKSDILWRNSTSGLVYIWLMNGISIASQGPVFNPSSDWVIQGVGDFNGDGMSDILWRNSNTGQVYIWLVNRTSIISQGSPGTVSSNWHINTQMVTSGGSGPNTPQNAVSVSSIQTLSNWIAATDTESGSGGGATGTMTLVSAPAHGGGQALQFMTNFTGSGDERYSTVFGDDTIATNFVWDGWVYLDHSVNNIANLEMDMNQVLANGQTVIYGFQCDGYSGTWDYTINAGTPQIPVDEWVHSSAPCNVQNWSTQTWHHVQVQYSRDDLGNVTYKSVWLDGVQSTINATVPSAFALGWGQVLLTNFEIDGLGTSGSSTVYLDDLTVYRW